MTRLQFVHISCDKLRRLTSLLSGRGVYGLTWELISVTRSNSRVTAAGVGSSLEARVACWK